MPAPRMHPEIEPIGFLVGSWQGEGAGEYPTIESFGYGEEVRFWHVGKPFLAYSQRTWALTDGRPLHAESGFWRPRPGGELEVVMAHPTGVVEIYRGTVRGVAIELQSTLVGLTPSAKKVERLKRSFLLGGDLLTYEVAMAAVGEPLQHHLAGELRRNVADAGSAHGQSP